METAEHTITVHLVAPLIHYFPLYLSLKDYASEQGSAVAYSFERTDEEVLQRCWEAHDADPDDATHLHLALTSGDFVANFNRTMKRQCLTGLYPIIARAPIWGFLLNCGVDSLGRARRCGRSETLAQLRSRKDLLEQDWFSYGAGTTVHSFCRDRVGVEPCGTAPNTDEEIGFGKEFAVLDSVVDGKARGVFTISPWALPGSACRKAARGGGLAVFEMPRAPFPFTLICMPSAYLDDSQANGAMEVVENLLFGSPKTGLRGISGVVADLYSAGMGHMPTETADDTLHPDEINEMACALRKSDEPAYSAAPTDDDDSVLSCRHGCCSNHGNDELAGRQSYRMRGLASEIVELYRDRIGDGHTTSSQEWRQHLPERLYEALVCLAVHEIYPMDEAAVMAKIESSVFDHSQVALLRKVEHRDALEARLRAEDERLRAGLATGLYHQLGQVLEPASMVAGTIADVAGPRMLATLKQIARDKAGAIPEVHQSQIFGLERKWEETARELVYLVRQAKVFREFAYNTIRGFEDPKTSQRLPLPDVVRTALKTALLSIDVSGPGVLTSAVEQAYASAGVALEVDWRDMVGIEVSEGMYGFILQELCVNALRYLPQEPALRVLRASVVTMSSSQRALVLENRISEDQYQTLSERPPRPPSEPPGKNERGWGLHGIWAYFAHVYNDRGFSGGRPDRRHVGHTHECWAVTRVPLY